MTAEERTEFSKKGNAAQHKAGKRPKFRTREEAQEAISTRWIKEN